MLTYLPSDVLPDTGALTNGADFNNDGHGFAVVVGDMIIVERSMDAEYLIAEFARVRERHPDGPALFHSRFSTHGSVDSDNCHPFAVGGDSRTVLAHNGILPETVQPGKGDIRSDTRIAAEDFLPGDPFGSFGSRRGRDKLGRWMGKGNKVVILTVDRRYRETAYVINEKSGQWDGGVWYSNSDYRASQLTGVGYGFGDGAYRQWWKEAADYEVTCWDCGEIDAMDAATGLCRLCGACFDCGEPDGWCVCYVPAELDSQKVHA